MAVMILAGAGSADPGPTPTTEPIIAPAEERKAYRDQNRRGFVPHPLDLSHYSAPPATDRLPIASRFDWREAGMVSSVKNQGGCGSCYAFASAGCFESRLLIEGQGLYNLSENSIKECEYYGSSCGGGNFWRVASFLAASGTVLESCDPYVPANVSCNGSCDYQHVLLDWRYLASGSIPPVAVLKSYIQTYGPLYTAMYAGNGDAWYSEMLSYDGSYTLHYTGGETPNHAVLIVGWDDDLTHAGGQGAWIVKNSWGSSWGGTCGYGAEGGYFTIAYGSASIGTAASFVYDWQAYDPDSYLLYYDEGGFVGALGYGITTAYGMCKFTPGNDVEVERVEFWTADSTTDVDVYVYDHFSGSSVSGLLASELNSSFAHPGYHSVPLSSPPEVSSGEDIYVVVKITDASYTYPITYDNVGPLAPGCNYLSATGSSYSSVSYDLGIRIRVTEPPSCSGMQDEPSILGVSDVAGDGGGYVRIIWRKSSYDALGSSPEICRYKIWRKRQEVLPPLLGNPAVGGPFEAGLSSLPWELVGVVPATADCVYDFDAPTHGDSSASDTCWTYYYVSGHTGTVGEHFDSPVQRGYSVDNLGMLQADDLRGRPESPMLCLQAPLPNPAGGAFTVRLEMPAEGWVTLELFDVTGRRVAVLVEDRLDRGRHVFEWSETGERALTPGLYFIRLVTDSAVETEKLVITR
jgi:C1A family cysteine protease